MRRPILPGDSGLDELEKIWSICGSPNQQNWPGYDSLLGCKGQIHLRPQERRIKVAYDLYVYNSQVLTVETEMSDPS